MAVEFLNAFPEIGLRLLLTDRVVDTAEESIDVAIRIGDLPESSMIATRIGSIRIVVCASPEYLAARGRPQSLDDLRDHDCIAINDVASPTAWKFRTGKRRVRADSIEAMCEHVRGRRPCGNRRRWIDAGDVLQDGCSEACWIA
jgi:DNA-binding transcriptional LysR family regulator